MASEDHIKLVLSGAEALANWHRANPTGVLDLRRADFHKRDLSGFSLQRANLEWADFRSCDLIGTDFSGAALAHADFHKAEMRGADLSGCDLTETNFEDAILSDVSFHHATFKLTRMYATNFSGALGLDLIFHADRSIVDDETIAKSPNLPAAFLESCGRADAQNTALRFTNRVIANENERAIAGAVELFDVDFCLRDFGPLDEETPNGISAISSAKVDEQFGAQRALFRLWVDERIMSAVINNNGVNIWPTFEGQDAKFLHEVLVAFRRNRTISYADFDKRVLDPEKHYTRDPHSVRYSATHQLHRKLEWILKGIVKAKKRQSRFAIEGQISYCWIRRHDARSQLLADA